MKIMSPLSIFIFTITFSLSTNIYAEYYLVYSAQPCCVVVKKHYVAKKKVVKKNYVVKKKLHQPVAHYKKLSSPRIAVYYINNTPSCCSCHEVWVQGRWDCYGGCAPLVRERVVRDAYGYSYASAEITYNPDLTTGDDDTWVDPDMNIDR